MYTVRNNRIRIISARRADKHEQEIYFRENPWVIMVLDAGMKKSTEGKNIPKWHKERLETRREKGS